jgi:hypothetical protein
MLFVTVLNVISLAIDHYGIDSTWEYVLDMISLVCTGLFCVELLLKVFAYGFLRTFSDKFNIFDLLLIIASIVEFALLSSTKLSALRAIRILRLLRAFKVLRVTRRLSGLRILIAALEPSFVPALFVLSLLTIVIFVFSVLGMQFFGTQSFVPYRYRYDTIWDAALANFVVVTGDNWANIMVIAMETNSAIAVLFFLSLFFIGNYIIVNLFGAVIVDHLERAARGEWDDANFEQSLSIFADAKEIFPPRLFMPDVRDPDIPDAPLSEETAPLSPKELPVLSTSRNRAYVLPDKTGEEVLYFAFYQDRVLQRFVPVLQGYACGVFGPRNCLRRVAAALVLSVGWTVFSTTVTLFNLVVIAGYSPVNESAFEPYDRPLNWFFIGFYAFEMLLQALARGAIFPWTDIPRFDDGAPVGGMSERGDVITSSFLSQPGSFINIAIVVLGIGSMFYTPLRAVDSIRALRVPLAIPRLRMLLTALIETLPNIVQAVLLAVVFWTIFAIFGVQLFKGTFYSCSDSSVRYEWQCVGWSNETVLGETPAPFLNATVAFESVGAATTVVPSVVAPPYIREWTRDHINFDDYVEAMFSLFVVAIGEQWTTVMYRGIDATSPGEGPEADHQPYASLYFIAFVFVGRFLTLNILIGVLITFFLHGKRKNDGSMLLSSEEREFLLTKRILDQTLFDHDPIPPKNCVRLAIFSALTATVGSLSDFCGHAKHSAGGKKKVKHRGFGTHVVVLALPIYEMVTSVLVAGYTFILLAKGSGFVNEDTENWVFVAMISLIVFDMVMKIVAFSFIDYVMLPDGRRDLIIALVVGASLAIPSLEIYGRIVILLRTTRLVSLLMVSEHAQKLFALMIHSLPTLGTVLALLAIMVYVFAGVGVRLFGNAPLVEPLDDLTNFQTLWYAAFTLYQVLTTEGWLDIANAVSNSSQQCEHCNRITAYPFFVFFVATAFIVFLQLCAVVVVEYFEELDDCADRNIVASFADVKTQWQNIARSTSRGLTCEKLLRLLKCIPRRLTGLEVGAGGRELFRLMRVLQIPLTSDLKVQYRPFVHALAMHAFRISPSNIRNYATRMHEEMYDPRCYTAAHMLAARMIALKWREYKSTRHRKLSRSISIVPVKLQEL